MLQYPSLTHRTTVSLPLSPIHVISQEDEAHAQTAVRFPVREPIEDPQQITNLTHRIVSDLTCRTTVLYRTCPCKSPTITMGTPNSTSDGSDRRISFTLPQIAMIVGTSQEIKDQIREPKDQRSKTVFDPFEVAGVLLVEMLSEKGLDVDAVHL